MNLTGFLLVTAGLEAVVLLAVRAYAAREAVWRLLGSLLPLCAIAGAVLIVAANG